jgi:acyl-CoA reductase-like NAD-dependent aldehyde dehydrogenase
VHAALSCCASQVAEADKADVDLAVTAARRAFDEGEWPRMTGAQRGRILNKFADLLEEHADELAHMEALDNGKPETHARAIDIPAVVDHFRYKCALARVLLRSYG